jgi:hypothetical protein
MPKLLDRLKAEQPCCVYCGGTTLGDTVDHVPPISLFDNRRRPKGLEFLACTACNAGARHVEHLLRLFSRIYPDPEGSSQDEVREIMRDVAARVPSVMLEMMPGPRQRRLFRETGDLPEEVHPLTVGQTMHEAIERFAAKLGFALHYNKTKRVVPASGGALVRWYSNHDLFTGRFPAQLTEIVGPPETLRQGRFDVTRQFLYGSNALSDGTMTVHVASFRQSFAVMATVAEDLARIANVVPAEGFRPGFLKERFSTPPLVARAVAELTQDGWGVPEPYVWRLRPKV